MCEIRAKPAYRFRLGLACSGVALSENGQEPI